MKKIKAFLFGVCTGLCAGLCLVMLWLHRKMIVAAIKGEKLPEAPESCSAYKNNKVWFKFPS